MAIAKVFISSPYMEVFPLFIPVYLLIITTWFDLFHTSDVISGSSKLYIQENGVVKREALKEIYNLHISSFSRPLVIVAVPSKFCYQRASECYILSYSNPVIMWKAFKLVYLKQKHCLWQDFSQRKWIFCYIRNSFRIFRKTLPEEKVCKYGMSEESVSFSFIKCIQYDMH